MPKFIDKICAYMILSPHRVAKMRQVLQNGMSFANEREFLRCLCASAIMICFFIAIILSVSLNLFGRFFYAKETKKIIIFGNFV